MDIDELIAAIQRNEDVELKELQPLFDTILEIHKERNQLRHQRDKLATALRQMPTINALIVDSEPKEKVSQMLSAADDALKKVFPHHYI